MKFLRALFTRKWIFTTILVLVGTGVCVRLGIWQLDRLAERRVFNQHYLEQSMTTPLVLSGYPKDDVTGMEYRQITVTGTYDLKNNIVVRNQYRNGQSGYYLLTPLVMRDGSAILVERGWIPAEGNSMVADWNKYDEQGSTLVDGIIRLGQTQPDAGGVPDPTLAVGETRLDFWNTVNLDRISRQVPYKLAPIYIQPNPDPSQKQPPYPFQPNIEISDGPHLGYAMQWFIFATILFFGYPFFLRKQFSSKPEMQEIQ